MLKEEARGPLPARSVYPGPEGASDGRWRSPGTPALAECCPPSRPAALPSSPSPGPDLSLMTEPRVGARKGLDGLTEAPPHQLNPPLEVLLPAHPTTPLWSRRLRNPHTPIHMPPLLPLPHPEASQGCLTLSNLDCRKPTACDVLKFSHLCCSESRPVLPQQTISFLRVGASLSASFIKRKKLNKNSLTKKKGV